MPQTLQPLAEQPRGVDLAVAPRHALILGSRDLHWPDEAACAAFATTLARRGALRDALIELHGALGAGKTTFVRHLLRALGVAGRIKSPSYALLEPYEVVLADGARLAASHLDFYRFDDAHEWEDAGLRDVFAAPGLKLVEWPDKAGGRLPRPDLRLLLQVADDGSRRVRAEALSAAGLELLR